MLPRNLQRFLCPNHGRAGECIYKVSAAQLRGVHSGHTATHDLIQVFVFLRAIRCVPLSGFPCRSSFRPRPLSYSVVPFRIGEKVNPIYIALIASGFPACQRSILMSPHQESNLNMKFRKLPLCPLSYAAYVCSNPQDVPAFHELVDAGEVVQVRPLVNLERLYQAVVPEFPYRVFRHA